MSETFVEFTYDKTLKQPKRIQNNMFALYSSEKIKTKPEESNKIDMKLSICLPEQTVTTWILLPTFRKNGLKLENCQYISKDNSIINCNQPLNLSWKLQLDLLNRSMNTKFNMLETRNSIYRTIKQRVKPIKSQIYKNMKITF